MDQSLVLELGRNGLIVAFSVILPILSVALFIGVGISVFQAVTQVQEMTLTFVPKIIGAGIILLILGGWMMSKLVTFTLFCFEQITRVGL
ncbi:MAG: flagellar biosynthesis protein FliQ [Fimbriimonadaceae bacterium]